MCTFVYKNFPQKPNNFLAVWIIARNHSLSIASHHEFEQFCSSKNQKTRIKINILLELTFYYKNKTN